MKRRKRRMTIAALGLALAMVGASSARAAEEEGKLDGAGLYRKYCSACHGDQGKGDGVVSGLMTPHPTDLTKLAAKAGGKFPFMQTVRVLDGRQTTRAHGDSDMPVWGEILREPGHTGALVEKADVTGRLFLITTYLESIQTK